MTVRKTCRAITAGLLTCGVAVLAPTSGWTQSVSNLGSRGGPITAVGCLQMERDYRHEHGGGGRVGLGNEFVLVNATVGPATSVPEATCSTSPSGEAIELTGGGEGAIDKSWLGTWVEVTGMLKKADLKLEVGTSGTNMLRPTGGPTARFGSDLKLREINVESTRPVPVGPPVAILIQPLAAEPAPEPAPQAAPPEQPAATTGETPEVKELPHTASPLPLAGALGFLSLGGALALRAFSRRRALGRH